MSIASTDHPYIRARTVRVDLADETPIILRPLVQDDRDRLEKGLEGLSQRSRFLRFFSAVDHLTESQLHYLTDLDYIDHFAWGALLAESDQGLGVARYVRLADEPEVAEAAVAVVDAYQRRGVGALLLDALSESALVNGIKRFRGYVARDNEVVLDAVRRAGAEVAFADLAVVEVELPAPVKLRDSSIYGLLRAAARGDIEFGR